MYPTIIKTSAIPILTAAAKNQPKKTSFLFSPTMPATIAANKGAAIRNIINVKPAASNVPVKLKVKKRQ